MFNYKTILCILGRINKEIYCCSLELGLSLGKGKYKYRIGEREKEPWGLGFGLMELV